jgi:hypothetical protein
MSLAPFLHPESVMSESGFAKRVVVGLLWVGVFGGTPLFSGFTPSQEAYAGEQQVTARTDKQIYTQGENVGLTVTNTSGQNVSIVDRTILDAGVATIEKREADDKWRAIELYAAAAASVFKVLKPGDQHVYVWNTIGYNRSNTVAPEGTYRILIGQDTYSNAFEIRRP